MKRILKGFLLVVVVLGALSGYGLHAVWQWLHDPVGRPSTIQVDRGDSVRSIELKLDSQGFIQWPRVWSLYARYMQPQPLLAGEYAIFPSGTLIELLGNMQTGKVVQHKITLVEGATVQQMLDLIHQSDAIKPMLEGASALTVAAKLDLAYPSAEGWIFPDTYYYTRNTTDVDLLKRAVKAMQVALEEEWPNRADGLPYDTPYQALIMASIVERETGSGGERARIAGVFVRRMAVGMRLQTDPTVIYGMGDRYDGNITKRDLRDDTPYNTYTRDGLTPTPISNPGRASIHAALNPDKGFSLYFVAKGDGTHHFSDTLTGHNWAVRRYQIDRAIPYGSTPKPELQPQ